MSYKLLLFDLDETLLNLARTIDPHNLRVLKKLMQNEVRVSFATGRSPRCAKQYAELLQPNAPLIHFNGAMVRDYKTGQILARENLPFKDALAALRVGADLKIHANLYLDDDILIAERTPISKESEIKDGVKHTVVGDLAGHLTKSGRAPTKILFIGDPALFPRFTSLLRQAFEHECVLVNSEPDYMEVLPVGVNKATGAASLAAHLGISLEDVIAFGDNKNDIEMLTECGLGVAMGNSHETLRAHADKIIGDHDSDAIAVFLEEQFSLDG
ncbi:MAG: HAD family hydrolase [Deltaproteobacteria bacterium]|nr:HAD family hydrolase [Deltaproteobacteria bacterium]